MKKIKYLILAISLLACLLMTSCLTPEEETLKPPPKPEEIAPGDENTDIEDVKDSDSDSVFSTSISYNGKVEIPYKDMRVRWTNGFSYHEAAFDENGVAEIAGLDGNYSVTLIGLPENLSYNPNVYTATSYIPNVVIDVYDITVPKKGNGKDTYSPVILSEMGVYRAKITSSKGLFFQFVPKETGKYSVETWVSTSDNEINPKLDIYTGSFAAVYYQYTQNDGGAESTFTKNARFDVSIRTDEVGNVFTFAVKADLKETDYPCYVEFALMLNGVPEQWSSDSVLAIPNEDFKFAPEYNPLEYDYVGPEVFKNGFNLFDSTMFRLFDKSEDLDGDGNGDGDGYYHLYDATKYADNGGYGPILFASISSACRFYDSPFTTVEYAGNKCLTIYDGDEVTNYKMFIEGLDALLYDPPGPDAAPYMCTSDCSCRISGSCIGVCAYDCEKCSSDCRKFSKEIVEYILEKSGADKFGDFCTDECVCGGYCYEDCIFCTDECHKLPKEFRGYRYYCNSAGLYPVTEELKDFLQKFSVSQRLFNDGNGFVETNDKYSVDSEEADQWLFACGYYKKKN